MRWLVMAALAIGLCAAAAHAGSPLDAPGPLDAAAPANAASTVTGCTWSGGIGRPDIQKAYEGLVAWWGYNFVGNPLVGNHDATSQMWTGHPLLLDPNPSRPYTWTYKALGETPGLNNLEFFQWAQTPAKSMYKWIDFDPAFVSRQAQVAKSNVVLVLMMAHEFGHYIQAIGGRGAPGALFPPGPDDPHARDPRPDHTQINKELDADRLAGAYLRTLGIANCSAAIRANIHESSDDGPRVAAGAKLLHPHGSTDERFSCFMYGYVKGVHPFFVGDSGADVIGENELNGIDAACPNVCYSPKTGQTVQAMEVRPEAAVSDSGNSCPSEPNKPEPTIGPPVATGGAAPCVSNVFEKGQGCVCPPGLPVREEIGDPAKLGAEHVMVWCRRGKARM